MRKIHKIVLVMAGLAAFVTAEAQTVSPVDFMRMNPYQLKANPATDLPYVSVMSLLVGNTGVNLQNTSLRYNNLFDFDAQGRPTTMNLRQFANSVKENNFMGVDANVELFTLYRRLGKGTKGLLTIDYGIKVHSDAKINDDAFKLLGYGNSAFVGDDNPAHVSMDVNAQAFQELAVGYQWNVNDHLSLGGRAKLLFGVLDVTTDVIDAKLYTDPDSYALRAEEDIAVRMAMPRAVYVKDGMLKTDGPFKVAQLFRNPGFGIDFGAEYRFNDKFSAVAAVHDLGFVYWGLNDINMKGQIHDAGQFYDDGGFLFNGMDVDQLQRIFSDDEYRELFLDTLQQYFQLEFTPMKSYTTMLKTNLLLRGNYDLDAHNRFSLQAQGRFLGSGFRPAVTLAYNGYFYNKLDVCVTYTVMPGSYDNIGLGISGRLFKTCVVYLTTNNVIGMFSPLNLSGMDVRAGIVFVLRPEDKNNEYD